MQGLHGSDRLMTAAFAMIEVGWFTLFDVPASLIMIMAFGLFRLIIITVPVTASVGVFEPASGLVRRSLSAFVGAFAYILIFGTVQAIYLFMITSVFATDTLPPIVKAILVAVSSISAWILVLLAWGRTRRSKQQIRRHPDRDSTTTRTTVLVGQVLPADPSYRHTTVRDRQQTAGTPAVTRRPESHRSLGSHR